MVRLNDLHPEEAERIGSWTAGFAQMDLGPTPWITPPPLAESTIAIVSSAALHRRDDRPFRFRDTGYRLIPDDVDPADLVQTHVSVNFDRTHYQQDLNVAFPRDRLHELVETGELGAVSPWHFSVIGATSPTGLRASAYDMAQRMHNLNVDSALLVPV